MHSCLVAVDNVDESRLQAGTADEEAVDVSLLSQFWRVLLCDTATVQDAGLVRSLARDLLGDPFTDGLVDFLCLLGGCDLAGSDSPKE